MSRIPVAFSGGPNSRPLFWVGSGSRLFKSLRLWLAAQLFRHSPQKLQWGFGSRCPLPLHEYNFIKRVFFLFWCKYGNLLIFKLVNNNAASSGLIGPYIERKVMIRWKLSYFFRKKKIIKLGVERVGTEKVRPQFFVLQILRHNFVSRGRGGMWEGCFWGGGRGGGTGAKCLEMLCVKNACLSTFFHHEL